MVLRAAEEFGPYLVYEQLGIGGMATVHRAEARGVAGFRRPVALKRMLPHVAANEDLVAAFVREARLASFLHHANVAQTYELGKVEDIYFIAMELVVGRTLRDVLKVTSKAGLAIPIGITLNVLTQICDALDYAHNLTDDSGTALGIIHRDVSPSNIIVSEAGTVKLIDFGIAKASAHGMQTMSGTIKGKFGYMAPEYLAGKIDARADLFALGVIAHELLTGRPLFQGRDDMDTLYRVKSMKIDPPRKWKPEIPEEIDSIVMTALERDPDARWQRAAAMRVALATEIRRLNLTVLDQQVWAWVERVFEDAMGDVSTPAPTRVLGTAPSIPTEPNPEESVVIERIYEPAGVEPAASASFTHQTFDQGTSPGHSNARPQVHASDSLSELARTNLRMSAMRPSEPPPLSIAPRDMPLRAPPLTNPPDQPMRTLIGGASQPPPLMRSGPIVISQPLPMVRSSAPQPIQAPHAEPAATKRMGNLTIMLLLLVAAAASGAVVYFGLPYVQ
ncbi:MAG: protein kinase [Kofleriaceae bacterium]